MSVRSARCRRAQPRQAAMTICSRVRQKTARPRLAGLRRGPGGNRVKSAQHHWVSVAVPLLAASCSGWQSALDPHGPDARNVRGLIWLFVIVVSIVWAMVMLALAGAL